MSGAINELEDEKANNRLYRLRQSTYYYLFACVYFDGKIDVGDGY